MKSDFVNTHNARAFLSGLKALEQRGAGEACLMVLDGEPGLGKSATVQWWASQSGAVFLRAKQEWTPAWLLRELLAACHAAPETSFERMFAQAQRALAAAAAAARRDGRAFGVALDEVDHVGRDRRLMETIRDLSDGLEIPFVLVGMGRVRANLTRFPQIASRIGQVVEFVPAPLADAEALVACLSEVAVKPCLIRFLHQVAGGKLREIKEGIAAIERFGKRNPGQAVGVAEMAGQVLLNDRATGKPITVRT